MKAFSSTDPHIPPTKTMSITCHSPPSNAFSTLAPDCYVVALFFFSSSLVLPITLHDPLEFICQGKSTQLRVKTDTVVNPHNSRQNFIITTLSPTMPTRHHPATIRNLLFSAVTHILHTPKTLISDPKDDHFCSLSKTEGGHMKTHTPQHRPFRNPNTGWR